MSLWYYMKKLERVRISRLPQKGPFPGFSRVGDVKSITGFQRVAAGITLESPRLPINDDRILRSYLLS